MKEAVLEITEEIKDKKFHLTAKGKIDTNSAEILSEKLENALEAGHTHIVLNMAQVTYLSSIGIRVILKVYKQLTGTSGSFNIERPSEIVKNVLGMAALHDMLVAPEK